MVNRETDREKKVRIAYEQRRRQVRRRFIILVASCICVITILEMTAFFFFGRENEYVEYSEDTQFEVVINDETLTGNESDEFVQLKWLLAQVEAMDSSIYTKETVEVLQQCCQEVQKLLTDAGNDPQTLEMANVELLLAIQQLKEVE